MQLTTPFLAGLGVYALVLGAPADIGSLHTAISPTTTWTDTQTQRYHCEGQDVVRCEITAGGTCFAIDLCEADCFDHVNGASCVDLGAYTATTSNEIDATILKAENPAPDGSVAARDASPQEDLHYTCSRNRASILVCRYGFCSTDQYCGSGSECKDDCNCCKSVSPSAQVARSEVRGTPIQHREIAVRVTARGRNPKPEVSYVCSKDHASVLKCEYGFCSTDYYCAKGHPCSDNPARCKRALDVQG